MRGILTVVFVVGLLASAVPAGGAPTTYVSISDVQVSPADPTPGDSITITPTVRNLAGSPGTLEFDSVAIRTTGPRVEELTRVRDLGTLAPGSELRVPMTVSFDDTGTKRLRVHVYGSDASGDPVHVQYPVVIQVTDEHPQLDVNFNDTVATVPGTGTITVANGLDSRARNVELRLTSDTLQIQNHRTIRPGLESGATMRTRFQYEADEAGTHWVRARLRYAIEDGRTRRTNVTLPVRVDPIRSNVVLEARAAGGPGSSIVAVDVFNRGNVPIENVTVGGSSANATVPQQFTSRVPAESSRTFALNATLSTDRADIDVQATYDVGSRHGRATDTVELTSATPGRIDLTGVNVERERGRLHITGSTANVGLTEAHSVVVQVADTESVSPAYPVREFFVGTVPASDFVSFDVYARTSGNVSEIPVTVTYLVDGERRERTVDVEYTVRQSSGPPTPSRDSAGGLLVPAAIGGVVVLAVLVFIYIGWRNRGGN